MADDPSSIRSLAISVSDAVDAYAYTQENPGEAVLRVTPPFHGRMRARIHVYRVDDAEITDAIHVRPADVIADDVLNDYPRLADELESTSQSETDRVRERHADSVDAWRERARGSIVDAVAVETDDGPHLVELKRLE
ncbi:hypothetical protein ACLI4Z_04070 [Natrialbaceae archaeon A-arb3/5]